VQALYYRIFPRARLRSVNDQPGVCPAAEWVGRLRAAGWMHPAPPGGYAEAR